MILSKGQVQKYILDKNKLIGNAKSLPFQQAWGVQKVEPEKYIGKEFTVYGLTVSNHPLEKVYDSKTNVVIMISNGEVIGLDN